MTDVPNGWANATLSDLLHCIEAGLNIKCEERPPVTGERGLVKISAVTWGRFDEAQSKTMSSDVAADERNRIKAGDLLISRANTIELVGASVIVDRIERQLYLSDKVLRLVVHEPAKRWINYALKTPELRKEIENAASGNQLSMRNISQEKLRGLRIPLAPEAEQIRIADKLDVLLARVDAVKDRLANLIPLLKRFRKSVLAAATTGKLTEEWRERDGPQVAWRDASVGSLILDLRYGTAKKCESSVAGNAVLRIPNVGEAGHVELDDLKYADFDDKERQKLALNDGDLLVIRSNGSVDLVGRACVIDSRAVGMLFAGYLIRLQVDREQILPKYLWVTLASPSVRAKIEATARSMSGVNNINSDELRALPARVPGLAEQAEIVRLVELLFAYADRLEARLHAAQTAAERLTPALLAKAFRGELVPQDPNDEPASELLRRLRLIVLPTTTKRARRRAE